MLDQYDLSKFATSFAGERLDPRLTWRANCSACRSWTLVQTRRAGHCVEHDGSRTMPAKPGSPTVPCGF